jgi:dodecin
MAMAEHVYKTVELTGSSKASIEDAVQKALARATKTIRHMRWFQVVETRGTIEGEHVGTWQVTLKVGFTLEDSSA